MIPSPSPPGVPDLEESHIIVAARARGVAELGALLVRVCPAGVYRLDEVGALVADHPRCLECGACRAVAPPDGLEWRYPRGGFGVSYRQG